MKKFNIKESFKDKKFKYGGYATVMTAVVIAIVFVVNLVLGQLNWKLDLTKNKLYSLSDQTVKIVKGLKDDVQIYGFYEAGKEDKAVQTILSKYQSDSSHIKVTYQDPVKYPQYAQKFAKDGTSITDGTVVVEKGSKFKVISSSDMVSYSTDQTTGSSTPESYLVEQKLTSAIMFVTSEKSTVVYTLQGHQETALESTISSQLDTENFTVKNINLSTADAKLEAGSILLVNGPKNDFTADETSKIKTFMTAGGKAIFLLDPVAVATPNITSVLNAYGVSIQPTIVIEGDSSHLANPNLPNYIIPNMGSNSIVSSISSKSYFVLVPSAQALIPFTPKKQSTTIEALLTTSNNSWGKKNLQATTATKEAGDYTGPFTIADAITDASADGDTTKDTKLVVVTSSTFTNSQISSYSQGNIDFFMNSVSWVAGQKENISIRAKDLTTQSLSMTASEEIVVASIVLVIIPVIVVFSGIWVWLRRRHK